MFIVQLLQPTPSRRSNKECNRLLGPATGLGARSAWYRAVPLKVRAEARRKTASPSVRR